MRLNISTIPLAQGLPRAVLLHGACPVQSYFMGPAPDTDPAEVRGRKFGSEFGVSVLTFGKMSIVHSPWSRVHGQESGVMSRESENRSQRIENRSQRTEVRKESRKKVSRGTACLPCAVPCLRRDMPTSWVRAPTNLWFGVGAYCNGRHRALESPLRLLFSDFCFLPYRGLDREKIVG